MTTRFKTLARLTTAALVLSGALAAAASAAEVKKIAILVPEQGTDFGWNQQGVDAAKAVAAKYGLEFLPAEGLGYGDVRPTLRELAAEGVSLMIAHASGYNTAAPEIAAETGVPVAIVDTPEGLKAGLVADYTLSGHEGAYLAGVMAAHMTRTGTLGIVVSGEPPSWNSQSAGFAQGAKAAKPDIKLIYAVIGPAAYSDAAGGNRVSPEKASRVAGQPLGKADADLVRAETGFAIGGVAPVGHLMPVPTYFDPRLLDFPSVWGAAGTPRHIFPIAPEVLLRITGATVADFTEAPAPASGA